MEHRVVEATTIEEHVAARQDAPAGSARQRVTPALVVVIAALAQTAVAGYLVSRANFFADDFIDLGQARSSGMSWSYLSLSVFGHFVPLYRLSDWLIVRAAPFNYSVIRFIQCVCFLAGVLLLYRLLRLLFGTGWLVAVLAVLAGSSVLLTPSLLWWANSLHVMTTIPLSILTLDSFFRFELTKRRRWMVLACASYTVGLGFFDAVMLVLVELILLELLYRVPRPTPSRLMRHFADRWGRWTCLLVPTALDLAWRISHWSEYYIPSKPTISELLRYLGTAWAFGFVPGAIGGSYPGVITSGALAVALGQTVFVVVVVVSLLRRPSAWRAWVFFVVSMLVNLAVTAWARVGLFGPNLGLDYRYLSYGPYLLALTIGLAFAPAAIDGTTRITRRLRKELSRPGRLVTVLVVVAAMAGYLFGDGLSIQWWANDTGPLASATYFANFHASYVAAMKRHPDAFLYDSIIPANIQPPAFFPFNTYVMTLGAMYPTLKFDQARGTGYLLGPIGAVVQARFDPAATGKVEASTATLLGAVLDPSPKGEVCFTSHSPEGSATFPLSTFLRANAWFLRLAYAAPRNEKVSLVMNDRTTSFIAPIGDEPVSLDGGAGHSVLVALNGYAMSSVSLGLKTGASMCVSTVEIGTPNPAP